MVVIDQFLRTGSMKINPYDSLLPLPAVATLTPAVDNWSTTLTTWLSPITKIFEEPEDVSGLVIWSAPDLSGERHVLGRRPKIPRGSGLTLGWMHIKTWETTVTDTLGSDTLPMEYIRAQEVTFAITGFGGGEILQSVYFDGLAVTFEGIV